MRHQAIQLTIAAVAALVTACGPEGPDVESGDRQSSSHALSTCPAAGRYCGAELGGTPTDRNLYQCTGAGKAPTLYRSCAQFCAAASSSSYSFCAKTAQMPAGDLAVFARANLYGTELLWSDSGTTALGGNRLSDRYKSQKTCPDNKLKTCTNAGGECASFGQFETGAPSTTSWAPLTAAQLSIANAPDGTLLATFVNKAYAPGHTMFKCGTANYCDSNYCSTCPSKPDNILRKHAAPGNLNSFSVVAIPDN